MEEAEAVAEKLVKHGISHGSIKELDLIERICDTHQEICESLEVHEKFAAEGHWADNPHPHRR